jgi:hypothetical protein
MSRCIRFFLVAALFSATVVTVGCSSDSADIDAASSSELQATSQQRDLGKALQAKWEKDGSSGMKSIGRADLRVGSHDLFRALVSFDALKDIGAEAFETTLKGQRVFVVTANGGDDDGEHVRAFTETDVRVATADSPSTAESLDWEIFGDPVDPRLLAPRRALAAKVQSELEGHQTSEMVQITRAQLVTWGNPMEEAQGTFEEPSGARAYRWKTGSDTAFVIEAEGAVRVFSEFDTLVLEGNGSPIVWHTI